MKARESGSGASDGEKDPDEHLFRTDLAEPAGESSRRVHSGEVCKRGNGDEGVVLLRSHGHQFDDECGGSGCGAGCQREEGSTMPPVEVVALAQDCKSVRTNCLTRVKKPIQNVDSPGTAGEQEDNPWLQMNLN